MNVQHQINLFVKNPENKSNEFDMRLKQVSIQTINNVTQTTCVELPLNLSINSIDLQHKFIVTDARGRIK